MACCMVYIYLNKMYNQHQNIDHTENELNIFFFLKVNASTVAVSERTKLLFPTMSNKQSHSNNSRSVFGLPSVGGTHGCSIRLPWLSSRFPHRTWPSFISLFIELSQKKSVYVLNNQWVPFLGTQRSYTVSTDPPIKCRTVLSFS